MTDKERIEEMAKVLHDRIVNQTWRAEKVAEELYKTAVPEGSVVLSEEEYERLKQCEKDKDYAYKGWDNALDTLNEVRTHLKLASKETARAFVEFLTTNAVFSNDDVNEFAKQFGVEIKE